MPNAFLPGLLPSKNRGSDSTCDRKSGHVRCPRFFQYPGALVHGCAGRKNVIDQENRSAVHAGRPAQCKCTAHVIYPFPARQLELRPGRSCSYQVTIVQRYAECLRKPVCKEECLIETPLFQAGLVQGYGHDQIKAVRNVNIFRCPSCQRLPECSAGTVLELMNSFPERTFEISDGKSSVVSGGNLPA